ncbi:MAG TPA: LPS export ABC transporter periplasmic protein LptC [Pyrinomonadaceae bacterium]|nr:LPS export ABC transporter periplasmic protein LptC [Pyrinomonadaceae bacterium]
MQEVARKRAFGIGLRARFPLLAKIAAVVLLCSGLALVAISYYKLRDKRWKSKPGTPELSKNVTGVVEGYEQRVTKNDRLYLLVKASRDITYSDSHHELEAVSVAVYPDVGDVPDQITASRAVYLPDSSIITFQGNVKIETKEKLRVNTETLVFDQTHKIANTDAPLSFDKDTVKGTSVGAVVDQNTKRLDLKNSVAITVTPKPDKGSKTPGPTPATIKSAQASFEQLLMKLSFSGGVTVEQNRDIMSGDTIYANLNQKQQLEKVEVRGNAYLRAMEPGNSAEVHSVNMDFYLDGNQLLQRAVGWDDVIARSLDADSDMQLNAGNIEVNFQARDGVSLLTEMKALGKSVVTLSAPKSKANDPRAASKRLTGDSVKLTWRASGKDLERAEVTGGAELFVEPVVKNAVAERKTITAQQFNCDFFEAGNLTKSCKANVNSKAVLDPVMPTPNRGTRTITAQNMAANFTRETQDIERLDAQGDSKFNENDRNGIAENVSYTSGDQMVRLRGGDPTVWDSRARTKGVELDSDLANDVSYGRGKIATTYYSQEQTNGATPFTKVKSPVFVTSDRAEFRHESGLGIYTGNARAWQDDNFVKGDKLSIYMNEKRMEGVGHIQTALYNAKRKIDGASSVVPVFAVSDSMFYSDADRLIHYDGNVDIKQSPDRLTGGVADVYLAKETNDMERTIAQRNVVLTQPSRRGTGDWVEYTAATEVAVLKGNPAKVQDAEKGDTLGERLTLSVRDSIVTADDTRGPQSPGRIRSTHKIKKP